MDSMSVEDLGKWLRTKGYPEDIIQSFAGK